LARIPRTKIPIRTTTNQVPGRKITQGTRTGEVIQNLGESAQQAFAKIEQARSLSERTKAQNQRDLGHTDIETRRKNDPDLSVERQKAYDDEVNKVNRESAKNISIPEERSFFEQESEFKSSIVKARNEGFVRKQIIEQGAADLDVFIGNKENDFIQSTTPAGKQQAILERNDKIREAVRSGYISPADAITRVDELNKSWDKAQANYDINVDAETALEILEDKKLFKAAYPNVSEKDRAKLIIDAKNMAAKNKKEKKVQDQESMNQNEVDLYRGVVAGTKSLREIDDAEARGRLGLSNGIRQEVAADLRRLVTKGNTATEEEKANTFIELQDRGTEITNTSPTLEEVVAFRSDIVSALASGKIRDTVGEKWLKDTSKTERDLRKGSGWDKIKEWSKSVALSNIGLNGMGQRFLGRVEKGESEEKASEMVIEEEKKIINPQWSDKKIGDMISTPTGTVIIKGFFPDGEPDVEPL